MSKKHFYGIDILKFLFAILIVLHHYQQITGIRFTKANFYGGTIYLGYIVEFFFIISGFLCAYGNSNFQFNSFKGYITKK